MAKFLNYEDWSETRNGLKEHLTFTEIGKRLGGGTGFLKTVPGDFHGKRE